MTWSFSQEPINPRKVYGYHSRPDFLYTNIKCRKFISSKGDSAENNWLPYVPLVIPYYWLGVGQDNPTTYPANVVTPQAGSLVSHSGLYNFGATHQANVLVEGLRTGSITDTATQGLAQQAASALIGGALPIGGPAAGFAMSMLGSLLNGDVKSIETFLTTGLEAAAAQFVGPELAGFLMSALDSSKAEIRRRIANHPEDLLAMASEIANNSPNWQRVPNEFIDWGYSNVICEILYNGKFWQDWERAGIRPVIDRFHSAVLTAHGYSTFGATRICDTYGVTIIEPGDPTLAYNKAGGSTGIGDALSPWIPDSVARFLNEPLTLVGGLAAGAFLYSKSGRRLLGLKRR